MAFNDFHTEEIARTLDKFLIDASLRSNGVYIQEKRLTKEEFEFITNAWLIAVGSKNLDSLTDPTLSVIIDPLEQKMKDSEDKIKRIKQQKTEKVEAAALQLDKIIVAVITEFNKSMEDVMNLSIYTLLWYYNYALRLNAYRVETIAYGNGLIKKHRYFAE